HDTDLARLVNVSRHDADLAFTRRDYARTVRADQANTALAHDILFHIQHIECRNTFGNADDQFNTGICRFDNGILAERCRHVDHRCGGAGFLYCFGNRIEHRQVEVFLAALARRHAANHLGTVGNRLLGMEGALRAGKALADNPRVLVDQYAHATPPAALTTCSAASLKPLAGVIARPLSASFCEPSSALLPSRRTTTGILTPTSLTAAMMPSAIRSQRTMPPKMFTSTAFTLSSDRMILNASVTRSRVAPPPTSRKLAGKPPFSLIRSMVAMARPAPFTMQPMLPSSATWLSSHSAARRARSSSWLGSSIAFSFGWRYRALPSILILASRQCRLPSLVITSGFTSSSARSLSSNSFARPRKILVNCLTCSALRPSLKAMSRAWYGCAPTSGSMVALRIFSGVSCATFSISTPPSVEAMNTTRRVPRSITAPRYNSCAISVQDSTRIFDTGCPCSSVW